MNESVIKLESICQGLNNKKNKDFFNIKTLRDLLAISHL